eukprot:6916262-Pyramimonas_sp.AAC.1
MAPYYISHVEDLATGKHWRNPEYLGDRQARVPPAVLTAPGRWADVGSASVKYQWSRDQEG